MIKTKHKSPLLTTERLLAFSDGVFAIAITLLVLEIKIPSHEDIAHSGSLYRYLVGLWPSYLSYILSFLAIGIYWSNHHWLFTFITKTNHTFNLLNVFFLMTVSFMPFTTAILSDFIMDPVNMHTAIIANCIGFLLPIIPVFIVYLYAVYQRRLVSPHLNQRFIRKQIYKLASGLVFVTLAVCLSFRYPYVALALIIACMMLYLLPPDAPVYDEEPIVEEAIA